MARIFITGSADGLGQMAAMLLVEGGHQVVLHARNQERAREALRKVPMAEKVLIADLSNIDETKRLAYEVNQEPPFDAIIHNAGVYQVSNRLIFAVNTIAPYILTCLIQKPKRMIYLSSGMHKHGNPALDNFTPEGTTYSDSKLHVVILAMAVATKYPHVYSNSVDPGWVPTKMGGPGAPDDLDKGAETQVWLAVSNDEKARVSGRYFFHKKESTYRKEASDIVVQKKFIDLCEDVTGVRFTD
jgi:NAD(P)-dependent dehydrogenase (short-subunit alcohol dehydrogenase family)